LRYCARPPFALGRLRESAPDHLLCASTHQGPAGTACSASPHSSCSAASPRWCRRRAFTATATSACSPPTHRCALPSRRSRRGRPPLRPHPARHPPSNRRIVTPPVTPGPCCSLAATKLRRCCVPAVAARCGSSPSSPTGPRCTTSSATSVRRPRHPASRRPAAPAAGPARCRGGPLPPSRPAGTRVRVRSTHRLASLIVDRPSREAGPARPGRGRTRAEACKSPPHRAAGAPPRPRTASAPRRPGLVKTCQLARVDASSRWISYPSKLSSSW
jgi:hypothetical protein